MQMSLLDEHPAVIMSDVRAFISPLDAKRAARLVVAHHYLHRRPPISHAFGLHVDGRLLGVVTFGVPASRHLQKSACPSDPDMVLELNRLRLDDALPRNSESWFVSRAIHMLPPRIIVSYADPLWGHYGIVYRALNFHYAGWTDMERKTPRYDYIPLDPRHHTREAFRSGYAYWPSYDWHALPPPIPEQVVEATA